MPHRFASTPTWIAFSDSTRASILRSCSSLYLDPHLAPRAQPFNPPRPTTRRARMAKLATAREGRRYGPGRTRNLWEYINAALYFFATALLVCGFASQLSGGNRRPGLVAILLGLALIAAANAHDLLAHMAAIDFRFSLLGLDPQMGFVEFTVPVFHLFGSILNFIGILLLLLQDEKGYRYKAQRRAASLLIAGPLFWLLGSVYNGCQVYERADPHCQFLQSSVQIPFLMGSLLFSVGGIFNRYELFEADHAPLASKMTEGCVWLCIFGSLLFMLGGATNVMKVFRMQQMGGPRLEKLRGGAQERLNRVREERVAFDGNRASPAPLVGPTS